MNWHRYIAWSIFQSNGDTLREVCTFPIVLNNIPLSQV